MKENTSLFTVRRTMRIFMYIVLICFFCPTFLVSCSGYSYELSALDLATGGGFEGYSYIEPQTIMWASLILPVLVILFLFMKKGKDKSAAVPALLCTGLNLTLWIVYILKAKAECADDYGYVTVTFSPWMYLNICSMIAVIIMANLILMGKCRLDTDLLIMLSGGETVKTPQIMRMPDTRIPRAPVYVPSSKPAGYCHNCGAPLIKGSQFCGGCGSKVMSMREIRRG